MLKKVRVLLHNVTSGPYQNCNELLTHVPCEGIMVSVKVIETKDQTYIIDDTASNIIILISLPDYQVM